MKPLSVFVHVCLWNCHSRTNEPILMRLFFRKLVSSILVCFIEMGYLANLNIQVLNSYLPHISLHFFTAEIYNVTLILATKYYIIHKHYRSKCPFLTGHSG